MTDHEFREIAASIKPVEGALALVKEVRRLRQALKHYGRHRDDCGRTRYEGPVPCRCGLDGALAGEESG